MLAIPKVSIDYAVMEKSQCVKMVASDFGWSDLGSFESLHDAMVPDAEGNVLLAGGFDTGHIAIGSSDNFIYSESKRVATIDVSGLMIVDTKDALLVSLRASSQKVKDVVDVLKLEDSSLKDCHVAEYWPWGNYTLRQSGDRY